MKFSPDPYIKALNFSAAAHKGQLIRGTDLPYILHPVRVAAELFPVLNSKPDLNRDLALQAALLHDTIEDTPVTPGQIEQEFGTETARAVLALTKNPDLPPETRMTDSLERIKQLTIEVSLVKLCDRITNLERPPADWSGAKTAEYLNESRLILRHLAGADLYLAERLTKKIREYEAYVAEKSSGENPFVRIPGFSAKIYSPGPNSSVKKRYPCKDCFSCGFCSDERCALCLKRC